MPEAKVHRVMEVRPVGSTTSSMKGKRFRSFHFRYLELCRSKSLVPLAGIRGKNNVKDNFTLDFYGDKLGVADWLMINESLYYDLTLKNLYIRLRRNGSVAEKVNTEKKAKLFHDKPVIFTQFIFSEFVFALCNCLEHNQNLRELHLEGLPFSESDIQLLAKGIAENKSIQEVSFQRSLIRDAGCAVICNTIKYCGNVVKLNLTACELTAAGADCVAGMLKLQKIGRYTDIWQGSLRYRTVNPDKMPGLRTIVLSRNPQIGDKGLKPIVQVLEEDCWIKVIEVENCGLTDNSFACILQCLKVNTYIKEFNIGGNPEISACNVRQVREQLAKTASKNKAAAKQQAGVVDEPEVEESNEVVQLKRHIRILQDNLKQAELLNNQLNDRIEYYEKQMKEQAQVLESLKIENLKRDKYSNIAVAVTKVAAVATGDNNSFLECHDVVYSARGRGRGFSSSVESLQHETPAMTPAASSRPNGFKMRKVKSEMKYADEMPPKTDQKNESKSDHEFANETDYNLKLSHIDTNIGDSIRVQNLQRYAGGEVNLHSEKHVAYPSMSFDEYVATERHYQHQGGGNSGDIQPMKVFIKHGSSCLTSTRTTDSSKTLVPISPRSLFFGPNDV